MSETKQCPYCGEEILATAQKCKHCGEWLEYATSPQPLEKLEEKENNSSFSSRLLTCGFLSLCGWLLLHFGSWNLVFSKHLSALDHLALKFISKSDVSDNLIVNSHLVLVRVNDAYYGFTNNVHYFDSPVIQWIMFFGAFSLFSAAISSLFGEI